MTENTSAVAEPGISEERLSHIETACLLFHFVHDVLDSELQVIGSAEMLDHVTKNDMKLSTSQVRFTDLKDLKQFMKQAIIQRANAIFHHEMKLRKTKAREAFLGLVSDIPDLVDLPENSDILEVDDLPALSAIDTELRRRADEMGAVLGIEHRFFHPEYGFDYAEEEPF